MNKQPNNGGMETTFFSNEDKRTTTCVVKFRNTKYYWDFKSTATVKCLPGDAWDKKRGEDIAKAKAHKHYHKAVCGIELKAIRAAEAELARARAAYDAHYAIIQKIDTEIKTLGGRTE